MRKKATAKSRRANNKSVQRYQKTPKGRATQKRYWTSPKGQERTRRYEESPLGIEKLRQARKSPLGRERRRRANEKWYDKSMKEYRVTPAYRKYQREYKREHRLDQALDTTRDDYNPVRAAKLLARWIARENLAT